MVPGALTENPGARRAMAAARCDQDRFTEAGKSMGHQVPSCRLISVRFDSTQRNPWKLSALMIYILLPLWANSPSG